MKEIICSIAKKLAVRIVIIIIFIAIQMYLLTYPSKILGKIIDLLQNIVQNKSIIIQYIILLISTSILSIIIRLIWKYQIAHVTRTTEKLLRDKLFEHFLKLKLSTIQNIKNGELMSYFVKDIGEIRGTVYRLISLGSRTFFTFIITSYMMLKIDITLALATLLPITIAAYTIVIIKKHVEMAFKKSQKYFTNLSEYVQESTDAIRTTKAYSGEINQLKKFINKNKLLKMSNISFDIYATLLSTSVMICFGFAYGITIIYGSKLVLSKSITLGDLVAFTGYIDLFLNPVTWIPNIISKFKRAKISYQRLDQVFKLETEVLNLLDSTSTEKIFGNISIKNLSFNFPETTDNVLKNISFNIKQGETLGIIGTIGSGKTTLMNLLVKLYSVPNGKIFIDEKDINEIDLSTLRSNISYITQDNFLFSSTIKNNITLFKNDIFSDEEVIKSTEKSIIDEDINYMKDGINTVIGERGIDLSGGQKQRIVISRAFLNKSNIIIFDDTFSALDNKTEKLLLNNIKELVKGKTCIIISNRISDVKDANKILVLDNGEIIEQGTHIELLKQNGLYNKFYNQQSSRDNDSILV